MARVLPYRKWLTGLLAAALTAGPAFSQNPPAPPAKPKSRLSTRKMLAPAKRAIRKIGTTDSRVQPPQAGPLPAQSPRVPDLPSEILPPKPTRAERFFAAAAKIMTSTWEDNIFVWLPALSTDPNAGPTYGLMPVLVLTDKTTHHIRHLLAPSITHNKHFEGTATMRYYFYPTDRSQFMTIASYSMETNRELKGRYENTSWGDGVGYLRAEAWHSRDGSMRFFGLGPNSREENESGYTAQEEWARVAVGLNFLKVWRAAVAMRYRRVAVDPTTLSGLPDTRERFPSVDGIQATRTVANELRVVWDTRDSPVTPSTGASGELFVEKTSQAMGSDSDFWSYGGEAKRFFPWRDPDHTTVVHGLYEWMTGPYLPFHELPSLGGRESLRGYGDGRFIDKGRLLLNVEHRVTLARLTLMGVATNFEISPFFDFGTVFPQYSQIQRKDFRAVYGAAFRAVVKPNVVGAVEVGVGQEGPAVFVGINYPF